MHHPFMAAVAHGLARRDIAVLRFQFPFAEQGSRRPDRPDVAQAAVRAAVGHARQLCPGLPLFAGGKSFGGRMASQAQARQALDGVAGLVFLGFPLHPAGKPSTARAEHLAAISVPMLFLQGTRDPLAEPSLLQQTAAGLGAGAHLHVIDGADHAFHVPVRSGRTDAQVLEELLDTTTSWMAARLGAGDC